MILETERLLLVPLSIENLELSIENRQLMAEKIGLSKNITQLSKEMKRAYKFKISVLKKEKKAKYIFTYWQLVLKNSKQIIAEIGYNRLPDNRGYIEIMYSTEDKYRNKGYMTEGLQEFINWTFTQKEYDVKTIIATVEKNNGASIKVLQKVGMEVTDTNYNIQLWKLMNDKY